MVHKKFQESKRAKFQKIFQKKKKKKKIRERHREEGEVGKGSVDKTYC